MDYIVWNRLMQFESHDLVKDRFRKIHSRTLSSERAHQITSTLRQANEYFTNSSRADFSVSPLLTYYGISSLGKALVLMLNARGGEETIKSSHGLSTQNWDKILSSNVADALRSINRLEILSNEGLFSKLVLNTRNRICIHVNTASVDWTIDYGDQNQIESITLGDLLSRLPDLASTLPPSSDAGLCVPVRIESSSDKQSLIMKVRSETFENIKSYYQDRGYVIDQVSNTESKVTGDVNVIKEHPPFLIHSYMNRAFNIFPNLYVTKPFNRYIYYSQICVTYMLSFFLGMLVRYFPTHWMALIKGHSGDEIWPSLNLAQQYVEQTFPELTAVFLEYVIKNPEPWRTS